ncbi:unnamed protein product, partial [Musa textilis]
HNPTRRDSRLAKHSNWLQQSSTPFTGPNKSTRLQGIVTCNTSHHNPTQKT